VALLVEKATEADGVRPLSEHVMLHLRYGGDAPARNVLVYREQRREQRSEPPRGWDEAAAGHGTPLAAYAHLDVTDLVAGASAELVVDPDHRRKGHGRRLVQTLLAETQHGRLRLWAHGDHPGADSLARSLGFARVRDLWQLRRSLYAALPAPTWPAGVAVRTFERGRDEQAWLAANARAFADHPEQGYWTRADLDRRLDEPWFDPAGFFLAERDGRLVGFHWTKVHGHQAGRTETTHGHEAGNAETAHGHNAHGHEPIGEVYVIGVDPDEQGSGLGKALTLVGLRHLRQRGSPEAMLYVEAENAGAISLYSRLGFARWDTDVMYRHGG
jgi:mycothiol synthase